ncbi:MAG: M23 family metallopeptidase [Chloroflexota bacterium]|nr:M23 family metallopeptidase [Chloroflexota bacterium]
MPRATRLGSLLVVSLVFAAAMSACGIVGGASATYTPTHTATATMTLTPSATSTPVPTPTPQPTPTPPPPSAVANDPYLSATMRLAQARTLIVRVPRNGAVSATTVFLNRNLPMLADEGDFWVPIGAGADTAPGAYPLSVRLFDASGAVVATRTATINVTATAFPVENVNVPPQDDFLLSPAEVQKEINIRAQVFQQFIPRKLWETPFIMPVHGTITSPFGIGRSYNGAPVTSHHSGLDIGVPEGTPIKAAASGRVAFAGMLTTRGNTVMIDHGLGVFTGYSHLSRIEVTVGQDVTQGQVIGAAGHTGVATGPHLHWELIVGGVDVDPTFWTFLGVAP